MKHRLDGSSREEGFRTFELDRAPGALIDIAVRAARPIGGGVLRRRRQGDRSRLHRHERQRQSNLEHGSEDQAGKDEIWVRVLKWFIERFEQ